MKLQTKLGVAFAGLSALSLFAGCTGLPTGTTPATQSPIAGKVSFNNSAPGQVLTLGLKKYNGSSWDKLSDTTKTDTSGNYSFPASSNITANGQYQVFYDDGGQVVTSSNVNTDGVYVSDPQTLTSTSSALTYNFDLYWPFSPTIGPGAIYTVGTSHFGFNTNPSIPAGSEYQIFVVNAASQSIWSSDYAAQTSFDWTGKQGTGANPGGAAQSNGLYYYQIHFQKAGGSYGGSNFYGQTKFVPFQLSNG